MNIVKPSATLEGVTLPVTVVVGKNGKKRIRVSGRNPEKLVERAARTCYRSEGQIKPGSAKKLIRKLKKRGHNAMLEFGDAVIRVVCDRGVSHEAVRQRLCSFAQESTRFCNYSKDLFRSQISVLLPPFKKTGSDEIWRKLQEHSEAAYFELLAVGEPPELARSVLTNSLKTEIVIKANFREWAWIRHLRTAIAAHPQMREAMAPVVELLKLVAPTIFEDEEIP